MRHLLALSLLLAAATGALLSQDAAEQPRLDWTGGAPKELWRAKVGWGYSAAVVRGNRLYTTGYSYVVDGHFNTVFCLDTDTGKIVWKDTQGVRASGVFLDPKHGNMPTLIGPRSTPVLDGDFLYVFYQDGKAGCFKAATGQRAWFKDLEKDAATAKATLRPACCYAGTPLIKDDMLVLSAGSAGLALSKQTGDLLWTSGPDAAGQASPVLFQQDGKPRLAVFSAEQLCTLDPADGKVLWKFPWPAATFPLAPAPLAIANDLLISGANERGAVLVAPGAAVVWETKDLAPRAATPVFFDGYLYGPNQAAQGAGVAGCLACIDAKDGSTKWTQKLEATELTLIGGQLIVQSRTGEVTVIEASPKAFRSLGSFKPLDSDECWTQPAVAGKRLFVRSWEGSLVALDLATLVQPPAAAQPAAPVIPSFKSAAPTDWYQWRGPNRNGISPETGLNLDWDKTPPKLLFRREIGYGYASASVAGDRLYTLGWSWRTGMDTIYCLNANNGDVVWTHTYAANAACWLDVGRGNIPQYMGTRATPYLDGERLYSLAGDGQTFCLDAATGKVIWYRDLKADKDANWHKEWFISGSPLVVGNILILTSKGAGIGVDKMTGKTLWSVGSGVAGQASPVLFAGKDQQPCLLLRSTNEVFAADPADGKVVWRYPWGTSYDSADPLIIGENVLLSGAYNKNARLVAIAPGQAKDAKPAEPIWSNGKVLPHVASPILYQGFVYTPSGYLGDSGLACVDPKDGSFKWTQKTRVEGIILAQGKIIAQGSSGTVYIADATPEGYTEHGKFKALSSGECWIAPVLSGGRLYVRAWEGEFVGLDLRPQAGSTGLSPEPSSPAPSQAAAIRTGETPVPRPPTVETPVVRPSPNPLPQEDADWPCWRGIRGDNGSACIPASLPAQATRRWQAPLTGAAYSGVVVSGGYVVVLDHQRDQREEKDEKDEKDRIRNDKDIVHCFKANSGVEVWRHTYANAGKAMDFGSCPRSTPAIQDGIVYTLGARGQLYSLDLQKGAVLWQRDLPKDFRATVPNWGYCSSLLVAGGRLIVNPGSPRDAVVALELKTGQTAWSAPGAAANYGTFAQALVGGMEQLIGYDQEEVWGRSPRDGSVIWSKPLGHTPGYLVPSPLVYEDQLLLCGENGARLQALGAKGTLPEDWDGQNEVYQVGDGTPVRVGEMALAVVGGNGLTALEFRKGLKVLWSSGEKGMNCAFASVICGGSRALVLDAAGTLFLFEVQRSGARSLGKLKVCGETRAAPALAGGRLYVRDEKAVYSYELAAR